MKNFVLIGAAGYIAPRHMKAIKETGNNLVAALDPHDAVGILDQYFPDCDFFTEFERFDRHCEKLKRQGTSIDYVVVCSPNYLHDAHIRFGLRIGADVICEKPVVLNPWNLDGLLEMEKETGRQVFVVHQLRCHPEIVRLKEMVLNGPQDKVYNVDLTYITPRGNWYQYSWKGDVQKSGGIISNIGIHFFDLLQWIFGSVKEKHLTVLNDFTASGVLKMEKAKINWLLSIDKAMLPSDVKEKGERSFRLFAVDGEPVDFSNGMEELHTVLYQNVLCGNGVRITDTLAGTELVAALRNSNIDFYK